MDADMNLDDPLRYFLDNHRPSILDWMPVKEFLQQYPEIWNSRDALRRAMRKGDENGLNKFGCTKRVNHNRVVINRVNVLRWLEAGDNYE